MNRKTFFATTAAVSLPGLVGCRPGIAHSEQGEIKMIGGLSLEQLRESYRSALFDQFLPNMDRYVIDHEYGGFMTTVDIRTGERLSSDKRAWYEGRGMWVYAFLYNNFGQDPQYLEIARKSKDFILQHQPPDEEFWSSSFSRLGEPLSGPGDIYGSLFVAEGLAEYAKASGERQYFELARKIILNAFKRYDRPDYDYPIGYGPDNAPNIKGPRVLGHWMVFLRSATQMLEQETDPEIEKLAERCVDAIMNYHVNKDYELLNEYLEHDFSLPGNDWAQFAYLGHGIETLWMVMFEAARCRDKELFHRTRDAFNRHVRVASDGVYGGYFLSLTHVDDYKWGLRKALWLQEEILIGTLFLIEHTGDDWAQQTFAETEAYVQDKFALGHEFWPAYSDRKVSDYQTNRAEHYHHPRYLMLNLLAVERMIERGGEISGLFGNVS